MEVEVRDTEPREVSLAVWLRARRRERHCQITCFGSRESSIANGLQEGDRLRDADLKLSE